MTKEQHQKCNAIIHSASGAAAFVGAGLAQFPCSDSIAIVPIQIAMIISIGAVFGVKLSESAATSTLGTATATLVGRGLSQVLIGWLPIYGNIINATTAAGVSEMIGWAVAENFAKTREKSVSDNQRRAKRRYS